MSTGMRYKSKLVNPGEAAQCKENLAICRKSIDLRTKWVQVASVLLFSWIAEHELEGSFFAHLKSFLA
ncbi:unnamed protein product [Bubo scandiacus]